MSPDSSLASCSFNLSRLPRMEAPKSSCQPADVAFPCSLGLRLRWVAHSRLSQPPSEIKKNQAHVPSPSCPLAVAVRPLPQGAGTFCAQISHSLHLLFSGGHVVSQAWNMYMLLFSQHASALCPFLDRAFHLCPGSSWVPAMICLFLA